MPSVEIINTRDSITKQNIRNVLGYAVKKRRGYYSQLKKIDGERGVTLEHFKTAGFISTEHAPKNETFSITKLGDDYYKGMFGRYSYWQQRISGNVEKFLNTTHIKRRNING